MLICSSGCRPLISPSNRNCWRPLWTVRGKPLPLPAVFLEGILANTERTKQARNSLESSARLEVRGDRVLGRTKAGAMVEFEVTLRNVLYFRISQESFDIVRIFDIPKVA